MTPISIAAIICFILIVVWLTRPQYLALEGYGLPDPVRIPQFGSPSTTRIFRSPVAGGIIQGEIVPNMRYTYKTSKYGSAQSCDLCGSCYECPECPRCQLSPE